MTFARAFARASRAIPKAQSVRNAGRRTYSTQKIHADTKSGSDLPWALGAVGVTVPACFYILKASPEEAHHLHTPHAPHGDEKWAPNDKDMDAPMAKNPPKSEGAKDEDEEEVEDAAPAEKEEKDDSSEDKEEESDAKPEDKENKDSGKSDMSNLGAKPAENDYQGDNTIKKIPGDKGATKLRKDSTNAIKAGTEDEVVSSSDSRAPKDRAATSKTAGNINTQSGKQEKLSNTDTKHSTDLGKGSDQSHKGEGAPETAKMKGTVDPNRNETEKNDDMEKEDKSDEKTGAKDKEKEDKSDKKTDAKA